MRSLGLFYSSSKGHITMEKTGKSFSYIVWVNTGCAAEKKGTFGTAIDNALARAIGFLEGYKGEV